MFLGAGTGGAPLPELYSGGATETLPSDCTGPMTVTGPGTLDLGGHTVSGPSNGNGITVLGKEAEIVNGTVTGCDIAVYVRGDGYHKIVNLKIENNNQGIIVRPTDSGKLSIGNHVINNVIKNNLQRGIRLRDSYANKVINNYVENSVKGISIEDKSANNTIVSNTFIGNNKANCQIKGDNNVILNNFAADADEECFLIDLPPVYNCVGHLSA